MDLSLQETLNDLAHAFEEFKKTNNNRLKTIESKRNVDPLIEQKLQNLSENIDHNTQRLRLLENVQGRPAAENIPSSTDQSHKKAFLEYIKKGVENPLHLFEQKSLSVGNDADGGYSVPVSIAAGLHQTLQASSTFRSIARTMTISSNSVEMLVDKDSAEVGWVTETQDRQETKTPELIKIRIPVHEMYARPRATQKLLDDSQINIEEWLVKKISEKMERVENEAFIHGDGVGKPTGILKYPLSENSEWGKIQTVSTGVIGGFAEEDPADALVLLMNCLKTSYLKGASWIMPRSALAAVRLLKNADGAYIWQPSLQLGVPQMLLGYPIHVIDVMPNLENGKKTVSILFGNFKEGYQIVDRQGIRVLRDPFSAKPYVEFYVTRRVGGEVINFDAIKALSFSQ